MRHFCEKKLLEWLRTRDCQELLLDFKATIFREKERLRKVEEHVSILTKNGGRTIELVDTVC